MILFHRGVSPGRLVTCALSNMERAEHSSSLHALILRLRGSVRDESSTVSNVIAFINKTDLMVSVVSIYLLRGWSF
jgi:hypothetical protein